LELGTGDGPPPIFEKSSKSKVGVKFAPYTETFMELEEEEEEEEEDYQPNLSSYDNYEANPKASYKVATPATVWSSTGEESPAIVAWRSKISKPLSGMKTYKFEGTHWDGWKNAILLALEEAELTPLVLQDLKPPEDNLELRKYEVALKVVKRFLVTHLGRDQSALIVNCETPRDIWRHLQSTFENDSQAAFISLFKRWVNHEQKPNGKLEEYLREHERLHVQLTAIGHRYKEHFRKSLLLDGLNQDYKTEAAIYTSINSPIQVILANLRQASLKIEADRSRGKSTPGAKESNFAAKGKKPPTSRKASAPADGDEVHCYVCGDRGHTQYTCPRVKPNADGTLPQLCYACKKTGHISKDCPTKKKKPPTPVA
jgi:hypothetical protein